MSQFLSGPSIAFRGSPPTAPVIDLRPELDALTCPDARTSSRPPLKKLSGEIPIERLPKTGCGEALRDSVFDCARLGYLRNAALLTAQINSLREKSKNQPGQAFITVMHVVEPHATDQKPLQFICPGIVQQFGVAPSLRSVLHAIRLVAEACQEAVDKDGIKCRVVIERIQMTGIRTTDNQILKDPVQTWAVKLISLNSA